MSAMLTRAAARQAELANRHPQALQIFTEGLGSILRQWTALELAVHHQWGGHNSSDKATKLVNEILDLFKGTDRVYKDDITLLLDEYMENNFYTICEDESTDELGELLVTMFRECCEGNFTIATNALSREYVRHEVISKSEGVVSGDIEDEDENSDNDTIIIENEEKLRNVTSTLLDQSNNTMDTINEVEMEETTPVLPQIDPDGFETVVRGRKKKKGKL